MEQGRALFVFPRSQPNFPEIFYGHMDSIQATWLRIATAILFVGLHGLEPGYFKTMMAVVLLVAGSVSHAEKKFKGFEEIIR
tara:strand:+ start:3259 stop:3504 length:246 start_codon:yes stop_codon:yes gene_type:complete